MFGTSKVTVRARGVQPEFLPAHGRARSRDFGGGGKDLSLPREAPQANVRPNRHVEGAVGELGDLLGALEHIEEFRADGHRRAKRLVAEPHQLAVRLVVAQDVFERVDALERGPGSGLGGSGVRRVEGDADQVPIAGWEKREALEWLFGRNRLAGREQQNGGEQGEEPKSRMPQTPETDSAL